LHQKRESKFGSGTMNNSTLSKILRSLKQRLVTLIDPDTDTSYQSQFDEHDVRQDDSPNYKMNEVVSRRVKSIIDDFIDAAPIIEEAGFRIQDLEVELSVIPKLIPHFEKLHSVDEQKKAEILHKVEHRKIVKMLIKALFKADHFQQSLQMGRLEFSGIEIEVTAIPAIRLLYKNTPNENPKKSMVTER